MHRFDMRSLALVATLGILVAACAPAASPAATATAAPAATTAAAAPAKTAAASACTVGAPAASLEKVNIRFSFRANGQYAPFYLGAEKGFYAAEGINIELQEGAGGAQVVQTVAAGQDFMVTPGLDIVVSARAQGAKVKAVAVLQQKTPAGIAVLSSSGITKPEQLAGKKIMTSPGGTSNTLLTPYLRSIGIDPSGVTVLNVEGRAKIPALLAKQADAVTVFGNDDFIAIKGEDPGAKFFAYGDKLDMYGIGLVVNEDTIKSRPQTVKKLVTATRKAHLCAMEQPAEAVEAMFKRVEVTGTKASHVDRVNATMDFFKPTIGANGCTGCMTDAVFSRMEELLTQYGNLAKKAATPSEYYTNEFAK